MTFCEVLKLVFNGAKARRLQWDLGPAFIFTKYGKPESEVGSLLYVWFSNADTQPYILSHDDFLATDWEVVDAD